MSECQHDRAIDEPNGWTVCVDCDANIERWASKSAATPSPQDAGVETLKEALTEIAGMYSKWDPDGSYAASALFQASERARQALASLPPAIEAGPTTEENAGVAWDVEIIADAVKACEAMPEELTRRQLGSGRNVSKMESVAAARTALQHPPEKP